MTTEEEQKEKEDFARWMALAKEIMRVDRDLLLQLKDLNLKEKKDDTTDRPDEL